WLELMVDEQLAEQQERAELRRHEARVLGDPAEAGALCPPALEDRSRVRVSERAGAGEQLADLALHDSQPVAHDAVVVLARGVAGDASYPLRTGLVEPGLVAHRDAHDRSQSGE